MPNYVKNKVTVTGPKAALDKLKAAVHEDERAFSLNSIIPMPPELDIESSTRTEVGLYMLGQPQRFGMGAVWMDKMLAKMTSEEKEEALSLGRRALDNIRRFGFPDWYGWCIANWGTKWDTSDVSLEEGDESLVYSFSTAWCKPSPVMEALAKKFPDVHIRHEYADEDLGRNCGLVEYDGAHSTSHTLENPFRFACDVWGYDYEEGGEECSR